MDTLSDALGDALRGADGPAAPSHAPCTLPRAAPTVRQRHLSVQTHDATLHLQLLDLGRQYYVWVSAVGPKLGAMHLAIKTPADKLPAVATLTPNNRTDEGPALAQRLAMRLGKPVLCACNLPANAPLLQAVAERRLLEELKAMEQEALQQDGRQQDGQAEHQGQGQQRQQGAGAAGAGGPGEGGEADQRQAEQAGPGEPAAA